MKIEIFFCNDTYNEKWLKDKEKGNTSQYAVIQSILKAIENNDGGDISQINVFENDPRVQEYVERRKYKIIPSSGQEFTGGGKGIRHVKYAPTKSVALIWQQIKGVIYITFDDHAPVKYHRAISSIHKIRKGIKPLSLKSRSSRRTIEVLRSPTPWVFKGVDMTKLGYFYFKNKKRPDDDFERRRDRNNPLKKSYF